MGNEVLTFAQGPNESAADMSPMIIGTTPFPLLYLPFFFYSLCLLLVANIYSSHTRYCNEIPQHNRRGSCKGKSPLT